MRIYGLMLRAKAHVTKILKRDKFSDEAIGKAVEVLKCYTEKIDAQIARIKDSWARKWVKEDNVATKVYVEAAATAEGENTLAESTVKLAMIETAGATLTVGTATSLAVAEGGEEYVQATTFSKAEGVDVGTITTFTHKGDNFEKATEAIVLIDFHSIYDKNWVWKKHHKIWSKAKKDAGDANLAVATADVYVEAEDSATAIAATQTLAIGDTVSDTYSGGYATVG